MLAVLMWLSTTKNVKGKKVPSDHYDGRRFFNVVNPKRSIWSILKWLLTRKPTPYPQTPVAVAHPAIIPKAPQNELHATFINHATFLLQWDGLNILTDPIWSERASPVQWLGPKRIHQPVIALKKLPQIDIILLSHNHYDHLDLKTLKTLDARDNSLIITGLGLGKWLKRKGLNNVIELDWWESHTIASGWQVRFVPAEHYSGRNLFDTNKTLWGGFLVTHGDDTIYFSGDTAFGPHFKSIKQYYKKLKLALLPIGAYEPRWFMHEVHMSPEEALKAHHILQPKTSIGMHYGTFHLSDEGLNDPVEDLKKAIKNSTHKDLAFLAPIPGQTYNLSK